jgi:electron transfer flavoprotein beta subunit
MKILVGYKRVVDYNVRIQVKPDGSGVVTEGVKLSANPFDEIALEEALRLRDKGIATEVVVATIAPADAQAHLRNGWRWGQPRDPRGRRGPVSPLAAARTLLKLVEKEQPDLVILASRPSTTTPTRPARCSPRCGAARRPRSPRSSTSTAARPPWCAKSTRAGNARSRPAGGGHHRPAPQRAALHQAARHHEGEEQAARNPRLRRPRRGCRRRLETTHYAPPAKRSKGVMVKGRGPNWSPH